jgi:hypothetical protein
MRLAYFLLAALFFSRGVYAQATGEEKTSSLPYESNREHERKFPYFIMLQAGQLIECKKCDEERSLTFSTAVVQGIHIGKKLQTGIGVGYDMYADWQVMPIYGSVSWDLFGNKNTGAVFLQFNYGWSKPWLNKSAQEYDFDHTRGGKMISALIGYRLQLKGYQISFSAGTKFQRVYIYNELPSYYYINPDGSPTQGVNNVTEIRQDMSRVVITLGFHFQ